MSWDPEVYLRYEAYRTRPAEDLLAQVRIDDPHTVYDLGCGPGNSTELLARRYPRARLVGVDSSRHMLDKARTSGPRRASWELADLQAWEPAPASLFFANAALQWVPEPERVLLGLMKALVPGGVLALQVPDNFSAPSHALIPRALEAAGLDEKGLWDEGHRFTLTAQAYYEVLSPLSADLNIWDTDYHQILEGDDPVFHWTRGTALSPLAARMSRGDWDRFSDEYKRRLRQAYPMRPNGKTLFAFRRRFVVAVKP